MHTMMPNIFNIARQQQSNYYILLNTNSDIQKLPLSLPISFTNLAIDNSLSTCI